jgi:hypothetical protein
LFLAHRDPPARDDQSRLAGQKPGRPSGNLDFAFSSHIRRGAA